jgi:hypothetical protein
MEFDVQKGPTLGPFTIHFKAKETYIWAEQTEANI